MQGNQFELVEGIVPCMNIHIYLYICIHILYTYSGSIYTYIYIYIYMWTCVYIYIYIYMYCLWRSIISIKNIGSGVRSAKSVVEIHSQQVPRIATSMDLFSLQSLCGVRLKSFVATCAQYEITKGWSWKSRLENPILKLAYWKSHLESLILKVSSGNSHLERLIWKKWVWDFHLATLILKVSLRRNDIETLILKVSSHKSHLETPISQVSSWNPHLESLISKLRGAKARNARKPALYSCLRNEQKSCHYLGPRASEMWIVVENMCVRSWYIGPHLAPFLIDISFYILDI